MSNTRKFIRSYVSRIENIQQEVDNLKEDMKSVYLEAKSQGFDAKILRKVIAIRRRERQEYEEERELIEAYLGNLEEGKSDED